ncbi:hypothetical protein H4Q32_027217 [Labeo rohita]|uniref:Reverse transcriptase domain-containing protein n=1 Tax=Labeo rohita TaxID=84645 RepID=A0ABQ8N1C0_LABRO|nr:hypothetical protein H4Q32_027217 [Labeo rohita]
MALRMAASVCCSFVLFLFLFVCPVLSNIFPISFSRNKLLDIRNCTPDNFLPTFEHSDVLLDILVGGAAFLYKRSKRRKRGKRASALVKFQQRGFRTPLPSIHLANLRSLANKSDKLQLLTCTNKDFLNSAALCFTETWLNGTIPDSALHLTGFQLIRADRVTESSGKTRSGGLCFYINEGWCTDVTVLMCTFLLMRMQDNSNSFARPKRTPTGVGTKPLWNVLRGITSYKSPSPSTEANQQLADDLNEFYCRFEKQKTGLTPYTHPDCPTTQPSTPCPSIPLLFLSLPLRSVKLSSIFTLIFNRSLELCIVPSCFRCSTIIPVPKKPKTTGLNDYRPVALTSVVMKSFERLVLAYLKDITGPLLDPLQFAYRANSSAFNTIIPDILQIKLSQLSVPTSICQWITSLTDRQQLVRLGKLTSSTCNISTGAPQGCVLSPLLFSLYTNDCTSKDPSVKLLKFADDTTVIGLIRDGNESAYRREVEQLSLSCSHNNLELNTLKTVEMTVDFRRKPPALIPLTIMNSTVAAVDSFKFLGTNISQDLKWDIHIDSIVKKAQQRLYFLHQLKKFNLQQALMTQFYSAVNETAERIIGVHLPNLQDLYISRVKKRAGNIIQDHSHPGHNLFALLPSGRRYRSLSTKTSRHKNSFFPNAISSLNR